MMKLITGVTRVMSCFIFITCVTTLTNLYEGLTPDAVHMNSRFKSPDSRLYVTDD